MQRGNKPLFIPLTNKTSPSRINAALPIKTKRPNLLSIRMVFKISMIIVKNRVYQKILFLVVMEAPITPAVSSGHDQLQDKIVVRFAHTICPYSL